MPAQPAPSSDNLLLGKGQVFFDRFDINGARTGFRHMGNVETLELTTADDKVQKFSSMNAAASLYREVNRRRTVSLKITGDEFHADNLALVLMGTTALITQPATAVVSEPIFPSTVPGAYFKLAKLGPYTAVTISFGATPGVLGVDYKSIDSTLGVYQILASTILTGAVTASYTPTAYTGTTSPAVVGGGVSGTVAGALMFAGDPTTGPKMLLEVWHVNVSPDGALGLISDDFATLGLTMAVLDDSAVHPSFPLYQVTYSPT